MCCDGFVLVSVEVLFCGSAAAQRRGTCRLSTGFGHVSDS